MAKGGGAQEPAPEESAVLTEWGSLVDRRAAVISLLRSIKAQLVKLNQKPLGAADEAEGLTAAAQIKFAGVTTREWSERSRLLLSWRGQELAGRIFSAFDFDGDGYWTHADFVAYVASIGRPDELEEHVLASPEVWRCYIHDHFGSSPDGLLGMKGFVVYRESVESRWPIEVDVLNLGLSSRPAKLTRWNDVRREFDLCGAPEGEAPIALFQLLIYNCGELYSAEQCGLSLHWLAIHSRLMSQLRECHARTHIFLPRQHSLVEGDFANVLHRDAFLAWWFSDRTPPPIVATRTRVVLQTLLGFRSALLTSRAFIRRAAAAVCAVVDRGLTTAASIAELAGGRENASTAEVVLNIGEDATGLWRGDGGCGVEVDFGTIKQTLREFKVERSIPEEAASSMTFEFGLRKDAEPGEVVQLRQAMTEVISAYLEPELRRMPRFGSCRVLKVLLDQGTASERRVIRAQFYWKSGGYFDLIVMARMAKLGVSLGDLLKACNLNARSSHSLQELLLEEASDLNVSEEVSLKLSLRATMARLAVAKICEELVYGEAEAKWVSEADVRERSAAYEAAKRRTRESHGPMLEKGELPETGVTGFEAEHQTESAAVREWRRTYFDRLLTLATWRLLRFLKCSRSAIFEFAETDVGSFLNFDNPVLHSILPSKWLLFLRCAVPQTGLSLAFALWRSEIENELDALYREAEAENALYAQREAERQQEEEAAFNKLSQRERKSTLFKRQAQLTAKKLALPVMQKKQESLDPAANAKTPVELARELRAAHAAELKKALDLYSLVGKTLVGVDKVIVHSGKLRCEAIFDGINIFEILPGP